MTVLAFVAALLGLQHYRRRVDTRRLSEDASKAAVDKVDANNEATRDAVEEIADARAEATKEIDNAINDGGDLGSVFDALDAE